MVLEAVKRELLSMESLVAAAAIAFALPAVYFSGHWETMESGFAILWATAVYPPLYYRKSGATIPSVPVGALYGLGTAGAMYICFLLWYGVAGWFTFEGIDREAVAFVLTSVLVFVLALVEKHYVREVPADGGT